MCYTCIRVMNRELKVYFIKYHNSVIGAASNLKTAYKWMMAEVPPHLKHHFKGYDQVNRILKKTNIIAFPLPDRDWYYIERQKLHASFDPDLVGSAGVQPTRLRPTEKVRSR